MNKQKIYEYVVRGLAEFCANAIFLSLGCIGAVSSDSYANNELQLGLSSGLMVMAIYNIFYIISGAHITPAVTIAALIVNKIDWKNALVYIPCQFLGGFFGCFVALRLIPAIAHTSMITHQQVCITAPNKAIGITDLHAFGIEFLTTSAWVFVMLAIWSRPAETVKDNSALQLGLAVVALTMISVESTGASMSPARTLPPAVLHGIYRDIWVYFCAPMLASVVVAVVWRFFYQAEELERMTNFCCKKNKDNVA